MDFQKKGMCNNAISQKTTEEIKKRGESYFFVDEFEDVKLFSLEEMEEQLHTKSFIDDTYRLIEDGSFDDTFYMEREGKRARKFWSQKALTYFMDLYCIEDETLNEWCALFYFLTDSMGEAPLAEEIAARHNLSNPDSIRKKESVKNFLTSGWGNLKRKNKQDLLLYIDYMRDIRKDIENKTFPQDKIKARVKYEDMFL